MNAPLLALLIALLGAAPAAADEALIDEGRRLYRDGLRADGTPLEGRRHAGPPLRGRDIACVQCHRPSGLGTVEGVAVAPAITGRHLFSPGQPRAGRRPRQAPGMTLHDHGFRTRPAYDLLALARAMADGIGPGGEILMEYAIYDALRAGFDRIVLIIKPQMLQDVRDLFGDRIEQRTGMRIDYAMLSRHSIQSTSDQEDYLRYASIAANAPSGLTPEQSAIWSYPMKGGGREEAVFNMCNALMQRIHQSGH